MLLYTCNARLMQRSVVWNPDLQPVINMGVQLSGIQDKAREEIASAVADAREAQRERDEVMRLLESERLGWKHEKAVLQASVRSTPTPRRIQV